MIAAMEGFESHRRYLFGIAYRMLGSAAEAEDVVQEAWLRVANRPPDVRSERAWLSTVVTRLCLDELKSARHRREDYVGPWLPEPIRTDVALPADAESLSLAFLVLLESLSPLERAVYLLCDVFDFRHADVAAIVERDEAACRQILHRARQQVAARRPRFAPTKDAHLRLLTGFAQACQKGDVDALARLLAADVVATSDGGGKANALRRPVTGAGPVARFFAGLRRQASGVVGIAIEEINGWPALLLSVDGKLLTVINLETDGERIVAVRSVLNPDKLTRV